MSNVTALILDISTNFRSVVKVVKEGKDLNAGDEAEDSDYEVEIEPEQGSTSASEEQASSKTKTEPESLPVLTEGSFARYALSACSRRGG